MIQDKNGQEGGKEVYAVDEVSTSKPALPIRIGTGLLAAFLLHQTLVSALTAFALPIDRMWGHKTDFQTPPDAMSWLAGWFLESVVVWGLMKPSPKVWTIPFGVMTCFWFLGSSVRADTPEEQIALDLSQGMFVACILITAAGIICVLFGEGRRKRAALSK